MIQISRRRALVLGTLAMAGPLLSFPRLARSTATASLSEASARFGLDLLVQLASQGRNKLNLALSPASLMAVLALAEIGADPELDEALGKLLHLDGTSNFTDLRASLAPLISGRVSRGPVSGIDAVYIDQQVTLKRSALAAFDALHAKVEKSRLADPEAVEQINALVRSATKGKIPSIIDAPVPQAGIVLLNALYFKDSWRRKFNAEATRQADFHVAAGGTKRVSMMQGDVQLLSAAKNGAFAAVRLPYETEGYSLILVVNRQKAAEPVEFAAHAGWLAGVGFKDYFVTLALPRFSVTSGGDVLPALDALGLAPARSAPGALAGLSDLPLQIAAMPQKVAITVDEGGTTAAAATAGVVLTTACPPPAGLPSMEFMADKPFMFALHDEIRGFIMMCGYVGDPLDTA